MEPTSKPFFFIRFFRWLFSWRTMRRFLIVLACLVTFWALFHAEENWRGKRAWQKYKAGLVARGVPTDLRTTVPKPVPDEENFAATPFLKSFFPKGRSNEWSTNFSQASAMVASTNRARNERHFLDLVAWEKAFAVTPLPEEFEPSPELSEGIFSTNSDGQVRKSDLKFQTTKLDRDSRAQAAPAVLTGLEECEAVFAELRSVSGRPYSHYMVEYKMDDPIGILLPHLTQVKGLAQRLQLKACAELASGQSDLALEDIRLAFRLTDSIKEEQFLISHLVRLACVQITLQPIWEGLAEQRWSDAQLQEIQSFLHPLDFLTELRTALDAERMLGILVVELFQQKKYRLSQVSDFNWDFGDRAEKNFWDHLGTIFVPRGWFDFERINLCRFYDLQLDKTIDVRIKRVYADRIERNTKEFDTQMGRLNPLRAVLNHRVMAQLFLPALNKTQAKAAMAQTSTDHALIACALERYRLANGTFPTHLGAVVPGFLAHLPHDMLTGENYQYRLNDDGSFDLYSVGWNMKDDGGIPGKALFDQKEGDWVWRYPIQH